MGMYRLRNVASVAFNYTASALVMAGSYMLGSPYVAGAAVIMVGGISALSLIAQKKFMETSLVEQPKDATYAPRLGKTAEELYTASGLKADKFPIYDFKPDDEKMGKRPGLIPTLMREVFKTMADTHNAAAMSFGKPVIMISTPLLKLLDDEEEKAVLAHEFAHVKSAHSIIGLPQKILAGVSMGTNAFTTLVAAWATGFGAVAASVGARIGTSILFNAVVGNRELRKTDDKLLTPSQKATKDKIKAVGSAINTVVGTAMYTWFNPAFLGIWAGAKALGVSAKLLSAGFSRSMEYQADRGAVDLGASPLALITALRKMTAMQEQTEREKNDGELVKRGALTKAWKKATASHPTVEKRVKRLSKIALKKGFTEAQVRVAANDAIKIETEDKLSAAAIGAMLKKF